MSKRYVARYKYDDPNKPNVYAAIGGGLTKSIYKAEIVGDHHKTVEAWERLGYELLPVYIRLQDDEE